jgi:hypothetical protein
MEHVCVSAPPHVAWSVASLEARCGSLALVFIFRRLQIRPTRGLRPAARDPTRDRGPGRVRRSRWRIQDLLTDPRPRFNMAATQRSHRRTRRIRLPRPGMRPHLASVFKGSSKTRVNIGRPLIRGGTSSATGAVTGALLYSSRRSSRASVPLPLTGGSRPVNEATIYSRDAEYGDPDLVPCRDQHPTSPSRWFTDA